VILDKHPNLRFYLIEAVLFLLFLPISHFYIYHEDYESNPLLYTTE